MSDEICRKREKESKDRDIIRGRDGNFKGYTEDIGNGLYNHYNQDGEFLACTDSRYYDYSKSEYDDD